MTQAGRSRLYLEIGRTFGETAVALRRDGLGLLALAAGLIWLPHLVLAFVPPPRVGFHQTGASNWAGSLAEIVGLITLSMAFDAAVAKIVLGRLAGRSPRPGDVLSSTLAVLPALSAFAIVVSWAKFLRLVAIASAVSPRGVTPLLLFATVGSGLSGLAYIALFGVLAPTVVDQRQPFGRALVRSKRLLDGGRWRFVAVFFGLAVVEAIPTVLLRQPGFAGLAPLGRNWNAVVSYGLASAPSVLVGLLLAVFAAAYYRELCRVRDGVAPGDVTGVFD